MHVAETLPELSLLGGPLQRLGCRVGLVRGGTNTILLGVALGLLTWIVLVLLVVLEGFGSKVFSLAVIAVHVRFLLAIPLLFMCETWVVPQFAEFVRYLFRSGLVREASLPALAAAIRRVNRLEDSGLAEAIALLAAFALPLIEPDMSSLGRTGNWTSTLQMAGGRITWAHYWYLGFCLPLFRFLLLRWLWRLDLWWYFLWQVRKLSLHLMPTHSDGVGGLGFLETVHEQFSPLAIAISALFAAEFAENISTGTVAFESLYASVPMVLLLSAALFILPFLMFSSDLWKCRVAGMSEYMGMASRYVVAFDDKWIRKMPLGESELGSLDVQSLADLTNSVNVVRNMRPMPIGPRLVKNLAASAIMPLAPLLLLKYPLSEVALRLLHALSGL